MGHYINAERWLAEVQVRAAGRLEHGHGVQDGTIL